MAWSISRGAGKTTLANLQNEIGVLLKQYPLADCRSAVVTFGTDPEGQGRYGYWLTVQFGEAPPELRVLGRTHEAALSNMMDFEDELSRLHKANLGR